MPGEEDKFEGIPDFDEGDATRLYGSPEDPVELYGTDEPMKFDDQTYVVTPFSEGAFFGDRFRIEGPLGKGGMGNVYRAIDLHENELVALKVLQERRSKDASTQERFKREAQILSKIKHPGIVKIRGFGYSKEGAPWMAMELLEGETLAQLIKRKKQLSVRRTTRITAKVAEALHAAHTDGVIHRDLKPDNVFLTKKVVKILDFGLSLSDKHKKLTQAGMLIGTPRYMAPEQIRSAHDSDSRVDVYSLGVLTYEMLAGRSPFKATDKRELLGAILTGNTVPLSEYRKDIPEAVALVVSDAMCTDPANRYESATAFSQALLEASQGLRASTPGQLNRFKNMSTGSLILIGILLGILMLAIAALGLVFLWQ